MFARGIEQSQSRSAEFQTEQERMEVFRRLEDTRCQKKNLLAETIGLLELLRAAPAKEQDQGRINDCQIKMTSLMQEIKDIEAELKGRGAEWLRP